MENRRNLSPVEQTTENVKDYLLLQADRLKLRLVENFATLFNNIFATFVLVILACFALIFIAGIMTWGLAMLTGSLMIALLVMFGVFLIAFVIVYACRKKLIADQMVRMFAKIIFESEKELDNE